MQLYTKILIGMAVGALIGLLLGPNSEFLTKDTYKVYNAADLQLFMSHETGAKKVNLPPLALSFTITEMRKGQLTDTKGEAHSLLMWAKVTFPFSKDISLRDTDQALAAQLGGVKVGESATVWLKLKNIKLKAGGFTTLPQPTSGLGNMVVATMAPLGKLFMRLIKMVIVPLVFASLLVGVASLGDIRKLGRMGGRTLGLYMLTTAAAVTIGLCVAHLINPGSYMSEASRAMLKEQFKGVASGKVGQAAAAPSMLDNVLNIIPDNPIGSLASGNMLQIIFFAVLFGIALTLVDNKGTSPVISFFDRVQEAMVVIIHIVMKVAPYGVAALVAEVVGTSGLSVLASLFVYAFTVLLGLFIHMTLVYGGIVKYMAKLPILGFLAAARPTQLIAFSTSSSSAALPVTMECAEENLGISKPVASFVIPLGATVNMDGTALYQGVAAIFIAQVFQMELSMGAQLGIVATATMASIGAAGVPGAGIVTLAMVLTASGIPPVGVALILGMDRILDMFRTMVNVTGDLSVTAAMAVLEGETLKVLSPEQDAADPKHGFAGRLENEESAVTAREKSDS